MKIKLNKLSPPIRQRLDGALERGHTYLSAPQDQQVVHFGRLDRSYFNEQLRNWPKFHKLAEKGEQTYPLFRDFLTDIFFGLYLFEPKLRTRDQIVATHRPNHDLFMAAQHLPIWAEARANSTFHRWNTMLGLVYVAETVLKEMPEETQREIAEQQTQHQQMTRHLQELLNQVSNAKGTPDGVEDAQGEQLADAIEQTLEQLDQSMELDPDKTRRMMKTALSRANDEMGQLQETLARWGTDPGEFQALPIDEAMGLYDKIKQLPAIKQFSLELGRMRTIALNALNQPNAREAQEIVDVTTGRQLAEVLPNERIALLDPHLEWVFWSKLAQDGLLTWAYAGREQAGMGPFIVLLDVSGSTSGAKERWGKAFTLASVELAKKQQRDAAVIMFDSRVREDGVFVYPRGQATLADKVRMAEYYVGGGTSFEQPLQIGLSNIEDADGDWQQADLVLVTDGQCQVSAAFAESFRARCEQKGVRTHGVLLDGHGSYLESLKPICDRVTAVSSFAGPETAIPIFEACT